MNRLVSVAAAAPVAAAGTTPAVSAEQQIDLKLDLGELVLLHRSLQAIRTLGLVDQQDELVTDMLQLIDVALERAV